MECALCKVQYVRKAEKAFSIRLNNHRKDVSNPEFIPADLYYRKPWHYFILQAKFTLTKQSSYTHTTYKDTLKLQLKHCEDFWIEKLETTSKSLNQEINV